MTNIRSGAYSKRCYYPYVIFDENVLKWMVNDNETFEGLPQWLKENRSQFYVGLYDNEIADNFKIKFIEPFNQDNWANQRFLKMGDYLVYDENYEWISLVSKEDFQEGYIP